MFGVRRRPRLDATHSACGSETGSSADATKMRLMVSPSGPRLIAFALHCSCTKEGGKEVTSDELKASRLQLVTRHSSRLSYLGLNRSRGGGRCSRSPSCEPWPRPHTPRYSTYCPATRGSRMSLARTCSVSSRQPSRASFLQTPRSGLFYATSFVPPRRKRQGRKNSDE